MKYRIKQTADGMFHAQVKPWLWWQDIGSVFDYAFVWDGEYPVSTEECARQLVELHKLCATQRRNARITTRIIQP